MEQEFEIFAATAPGLEPVLADEAREAGFAAPVPVAGGVTLRGGWPDVWRANLELRGAARILARIGGFPVFHLAQLDKRARKFSWGAILRPDVPVKIDVICRNSKIYHAGAAATRIGRAIAEELGAPIATGDADGLRLLVRIEDNFCAFSIDTSGEPLHRRGHKEAVGKAPMRETLAALFLRSCGYDGTVPVVDPMCGSGTFVIEAASLAAGLAPGRSRGFAFERLAGFDAEAWARMRRVSVPDEGAVMAWGFDRDQGAVHSAAANAERAGLAARTAFACQPISALEPPVAGPGLVIVNPPYGERIGNRKLLFALYGALGEVLRTRFRGWRAGIVTSDAGLAKATGLKLIAGPHVAHGALKVQLFQTGPL